MQNIDNIRPFKIRTDKLLYPINKDDKYKNSAIYLVTGSFEKSLKFLAKNKIFVNNAHFVSYYMEKDFSFVIQEQGMTEEGNMIPLLESTNNEDDVLFNDKFIKTDKVKLFYPDAVEDIIFREDYGIKQNYSTMFRRFLYTERIKNQKELLAKYDRAKSVVNWITKTYLNIELYRQKNVIVDWSYYTSVFQKNNFYTLDRGVDLYHHFITHLLQDKRFDTYTRKTVIIKLEDIFENAADVKGKWDYRQDINIFSMIERYVRRKIEFWQDWEGIDFLIVADKGYFKVDFTDMDMSKLTILKRLINKLLNLSSDIYEAPVQTNYLNDVDIDKDNTNTEYIATPPSIEDDKEEEKEDAQDDKQDAEDLEQIKSYVSKVSNSTSMKFNQPDISPSRIKRMDELDEKFRTIEVDGHKVSDVVDSYYESDKKLTKDTIPVDSLNDEWKNVTFTNFDKEYDLNKDVIKIFNDIFSADKKNRVSIIELKKEDTSNHENYLDTYTIQTEDRFGTRSKLVIDIPKFIDGRYMMLRGNTKILNGQLVLMPIIKTEEDVVQIVTNYNKIFIYRMNPSNGTKSTPMVDRLTKSLKNYKGSNITVLNGDNSFICSKYDLPIEYRDLAGLYTSYTLKDGSYVTFDMDLALRDLKPKLKGDKNYNSKNHYIIGYDKPANKVIYCTGNEVAKTIANFLSEKDKAFGEIFSSSKASNSLGYSDASILNTRLPLIVVACFAEGLTSVLSKAKIKWEFTEKRPPAADDNSVVQFKDGYLVYENTTPEVSLLMSGLYKVATDEFEFNEMDEYSTWLDILEDFGARFKADGLANFYDCLFDPITVDICKKYKLPYDYVGALIYANNLLADTNYNTHTDITGNRVRTNELVAAYLYKAISKAYGDYANTVRHRGKGAKLSIKQSAVVDEILLDPGCSDLSVLNPLLEAEASSTLSFKGLSGMNSERSYKLDKRIYDKSMLGVIGVSTGFSANTGINRQSSINASVLDTRGTIKPKSEKELGTLDTLTPYEALAPYATTHDDPIRTAMGYIQTAKHQMRVKESSPNLLTYGMDEALPYMTSNIFSHKFKGKRGKVLDVKEGEFLVYKDLDTKQVHMLSLKDEVLKNSDGGFYVTVQLVPKVKKGQSLKYNDILAYDPQSFSKSNATTKDADQIAYNIGTLAKVAIMCTDEAYEDSSIISDRLSEAMTSYYCVQKAKSFKANTNVYNIVQPGQKIKEGDSLIVFQNAFDDDNANKLLAKLADDDTELINDFGRIKIASKISGVVQDVKIYRTCEISELSPSLKKIVTDYEKGIKERNKIAKEYGVSEGEIKATSEPDYKLEQNGKLKATENGVLIEFYLKAEDKMGVGDKLTYNTAIKGVIKDLFPKGDEPTSEYRPDEKIDALLATASVTARMTSSVISSGIMNKIMIETARQCKDILGIKWDYLGKNKK